MAKITVIREILINIHPCPFCGDDSMLQIRNYQGKSVKCENCSTKGPTASTDDMAVELWNNGIKRKDADK